jgi:hypothetical protein
VMTAATAYAEMSRPADFIEEGCPAGGCRTLHVTRAELGEVPLSTSRGTIQVPAWLFSAKGVDEKFALRNRTAGDARHTTLPASAQLTVSGTYASSGT